MPIQTRQIEAALFHLQAIAGLDKIIASEQFVHVDQQSIALLLEQAARFANEQLEPLAQSGDGEGCRLQDGAVILPRGSRQAYQQWCELGFPALSLPLAIDGLGFPAAVQTAVQELCDGANMSFGMLPISVRAAAMLISAHGSADLKHRYLPGLVSGEIAATICISEPQAGSDVGRIRSNATPNNDGTWQINGNKIWISYGDHDACEQIVHMVLARVPGDAVGTAALGLFAVPKLKADATPNGISVSRLEEKMGLHASPTCAMEFANSQGFLMGEPGKGMQAMFVMMNSMRLAVGAQAAAIANAATLHAIDYARQRPQGGKPNLPPPMIIEHADVKRMLLEMTTRSELLRALVMRTAGYLDLAASSTDDGKKLRWQKLAELLLPIAKTIGAETAFEVASQAMQVMGGYGYTNDYPVERLLRDARILAIFEGTSGIQSLDLIKRKIYGDGGEGLSYLLGEIDNTIAHSGPDNPLCESLRALTSMLRSTYEEIAANRKDDPAIITSAAYAFLQLCGQVVCCWCGVDLLESATGNSPYQQRLRAALNLYASSVVLTAQTWAHRAVEESALLNVDSSIF